MAELRPIRVLIVDDHAVVRNGLKFFFMASDEFELVGEAADGEQAVQVCAQAQPDVVLMDLLMPGTGGIEATRAIRRCCPQVQVIALTSFKEKEYVEGALKAGASGYLLKDCAFEELSQAIRLAMANRIYLSPGVADVVVKDYVSPAPSQSVFSLLTTREREVLQLLSEGKRTSQIAELLHISIKTVETHRQQIMHKLGMRSVAELTKYAIREGLTSVES